MEKIYELLRTWVLEAEQPKTAPTDKNDKEAANVNLHRPKK